MGGLVKAGALAALLLSLGSSAQAQQQDDDTNAIDDTPHVTIIGHASAAVTPDVAVVTLGVTTERASAVEASGETARVASAVVEAAKAQGVDAKDIQTQSISLTQMYDDMHDANGRYTGRRPRGFAAATTLAIRTRALDKVGALAQSLIEKGANQFDGIGFTIEHPQPIEDKLLADAVRDARRKAALSVDALGLKLGRVLLIEKPQAEVGVGPVFKSRVMAMPAPAQSLPVEAGQQTLSAEMEVTWSLEP